LRAQTKVPFHGNLKASNVFFEGNLAVAIGDLFFIDKNSGEPFLQPYKSMKNLIERVHILPPEYFLKNGKIGWKADSWAIGCLIYHMCMLKPPFGREMTEEVRKFEDIDCIKRRIISVSYSPITGKYTKGFNGLISGLLEADPEKRYDFDDICEKIN
jgi:serine/threonine protein kinase